MFSTIIGFLAAIIGAVGGVSGLYAVFRLVPKIVDRAMLVKENVTLREQIEDLKANLDTLQTIAESSRLAMQQFKMDLALSIQYIAELTAWLRSGSINNMPKAPPELEHLIEQQHRHD